MGIPDNLVVHNLIPGTGSYFYTDERIQLKNTSTAKLRRRHPVVPQSTVVAWAERNSGRYDLSCTAGKSKFGLCHAIKLMSARLLAKINN
jgi:hypothetical protein